MNYKKKTKEYRWKFITNNNSIWVFGKHLKEVDFTTLKNNNIGNIYLNFAATQQYNQLELEYWIEEAKQNNIQVHIWMQVLRENSKWVNPINTHTALVDQDFLNKKIKEAESYLKIKGISGINLDYIRYPGTAQKYEGSTEAITTFVKNIADHIHDVSKNIIVSGSLMPEPKSKAYGQDAKELSKYLDILTPMIYKGNYKAGTDWIRTTTKWYKDNITEAKIVTGLQSYKSDEDVTRLSNTELTSDVESAFDGGADGVAFFRFGLINYVPVKSSETVKTKEENNKKVMALTDLTWVSKKVSKAQFKDMTSRVNKYISTTEKPTTGRRIYVDYSKQDSFVTYQRYVEMKSRWDSFVKKNNYEPNWIWTKAPSVNITNTDYKISLNVFKDMKNRVDKYISDGGSISSNRRIYLDIFAEIQYVEYWRYQKILLRYKNFCNLKGREPNYLVTNNDTNDSGDNTSTATTPTNSTGSSPVGKRFSKQVMNNTANSLRKSLKENGKYPDTVQMVGMDNLTYTLIKAQYMGLYETQNGYIVKNNTQPSYTTLVCTANNPLVYNHQDNGTTCCPTSCSMGIGMLFDYHSETDLKRLFGTGSNGTSPSSMVSALNNLGYNCTRMNRSFSNVKAAINRGHPVVCHYQTKSTGSCTGFVYDYGHYCLIYGVGDGTYKICDPTKSFVTCRSSVMDNATNGRAIYYYELSPE